MDLNTLHSLLTPSGQDLLQTIQALQPREDDFLSHYQALSRHHPPELARLALETAILRGEAAHKFPPSIAEKLYLTRPALEQATSFAVSTYRAARYRGFERILDLGCSVGGDTLALAGSAPVIGIDRDDQRLHLAQANLAALGLSARAHFVQADLRRPLPAAAPVSALFFDPARRTGHRRIFSVQDYQPPLPVVQDWLPRFPALGVKISPGVDLAELEGYPAEVEFISLQGELKEAVLWFGPLKTAIRRATLLPGSFTLAGDPADLPALPLADPQRYLYEPDAAVLRTGLVALLGAQLNASQLDPDIAYLTTAVRVETPFARCWEITSWLPFQLKRLRQHLRELNVGQVVVKKRGSPLEPEKLIRDLHLHGERKAVIFLTHLRGKPVVLVSLGTEAGSPGQSPPTSLLVLP